MMDFAGCERVLFGSDSPSFRSFMSNADWVQTIKDLPGNAPEGIHFKEAGNCGPAGRKCAAGDETVKGIRGQKPGQKVER